MYTQDFLPGIEQLAAQDEGISYADAQQISDDAREEWERTAPDNPLARDLLQRYHALEAQGWSWRQALYIAWAITPGKARWPTTLDELSNVMGLRSTRTIRTWRYQNPEIDNQVRMAVLRSVADRSAEVLDAAFGVALEEGYRGYNDRRMLLEIGGVYRQQQEVQLRAHVTSDEMAAAAREAERAAIEFERARFGEPEELPFSDPPLDEEDDEPPF